MTDELNPELTEEATDPLGAPNSQEEQDDDWSPEELPAEDRTQYDKAVQAVDDFVAKHPEYKQTEENRRAILDYLAEHDLVISPASLEWEQLQDGLELEQPESQGQEPPKSGDEEPKEADRVRRASTTQLARTKGVESEEAEESEPEEPKTARGKSVAGWRNGRRLDVGA